METISSIVHPCDDVQELLIRLPPLYLFLNDFSHPFVLQPVSLDFFLNVWVKFIKIISYLLYESKP